MKIKLRWALTIGPRFKIKGKRGSPPSRKLLEFLDGNNLCQRACDTLRVEAYEE